MKSLFAVVVMLLSLVGCTIPVPQNIMAIVAQVEAGLRSSCSFVADEKELIDLVTSLAGVESYAQIVYDICNQVTAQRAAAVKGRRITVNVRGHVLHGQRL